MGENPSAYQRDNLIDREFAHPVEYVSWFDATEAARRLSLRLPTESEWEYAARGSTNSAYIVDRDQLSRVAIHDKRKHNVVGSLHANGFGLHDIFGNVWEWTDDYFSAYVYGGARPQLEDKKIVRGGGFDSNPRQLRSAHRWWKKPQSQTEEIGVRFVRPLTP